VRRPDEFVPVDGSIPARISHQRLEKRLYLLPGGITLAVGFLIVAIAALRSALAVSLVVALPFMVLGLYLLIWTLRSSVVIDSTRIAVRGAFLERTAALSDIEGFRMISSRYGSPRGSKHIITQA
jgi:hypothetical protein